MADDEFIVEQKTKANARRQQRVEQMQKAVQIALLCEGCKSAGPAEPMETVILEKTIIKLGSLLALGFGEAGANIISKNMSGAAQQTAGVNAMLPGERVECIIGYARIRNFSTAT